MKLAAWLLGLPLALLGPMVQDGGSKDFSEAREAAASELVHDVEKYAGWCGGNKLFAERDQAWLVMLELDPDHAGAHKGLGHRLDKNGVWQPSEKRKVPKNHSEKKLAEASERWAKTMEPYRDRLLELMDTYAEEMSVGQRKKLIHELLTMSPDDPELRRLNGEARFEDRWVLIETMTAKKRRPEMKGFVDHGFKGALEPERITPDAHEAALGIEWKESWGTSLVRVLTTGDEQEAKRAVAAGHAAGVFFKRTLGAEAKYPKDMRFLLLAEPENKAALLASHPKITDATRDWLEVVLGAGVPFTGDFCHWSSSPAQRRDGVMRIVFAWFLQRGYGITHKQGWVSEGFGLYLTRTLVGTRLNWFALPSERSTTVEHNAFLAKLYKTNTNWMSLAHKELNGDQPPKLSKFMKKETNALTSRELLYSYVLAAYLLEGRPQDTPRFLSLIGAGKDPRVAIQEGLGLEVEGLEKRVKRWLSERK